MRSDRYLEWMERGNGTGLATGLVCVGGATLGGLLGIRAVFEHPLQVYGMFFVAGFIVGKGVGWAMMAGSGSAARSIYMPTAAGSYTMQHSQIDAMEAKADFKGAVAAWGAVAVSEPGNPWPLIRAGEIYYRKLKAPEMALDRFRHARDIPGISAEHHRYVMLKLVDLYMGPLNDNGRALVELRRLVEHHPGTREAELAREGIAKLKSERRRD